MSTASELGRPLAGFPSSTDVWDINQGNKARMLPVPAKRLRTQLKLLPPSIKLRGSMYPNSIFFGSKVPAQGLV